MMTSEFYTFTVHSEKGVPNSWLAWMEINASQWKSDDELRRDDDCTIIFEYAQLTGKERVNFDSDEWILLLSGQYDAERKCNKAEHLQIQRDKSWVLRKSLTSFWNCLKIFIEVTTE